MEMKNFFKRIWNFFRPEKKGEVIQGEIMEVSHDGFEPLPEASQSVKVSKPKKPHTQLFRNQQLPGKIYNIGKSRFRINKKLTETTDGRLKYIITKLI